MKLKIKCFTDGALVVGQLMRATQEIEGDFDANQVARLEVIAAAGDISITALDEPEAEKAAARAKASDKP